ncbi:MAG: ubiquinol-cytochrome c reductase iron-sulfur subunit [Candidatus Nanopelagicaceae bacterium]|jgi:Rieske Fe-S protein
MEAISRRTAITGACGILLLSGLGEIPAAANSAVKKLANGRLSVQLKRIPELSKVGGSVSIGNVKGAPVAITRTGTSSYTAFSLNCPHQNVKLTKTESGWICDPDAGGHGSEFKANGDLVMGPATTRLVRVPIKVSRGVATVG